jgi:hypothetical protein
VFVSQWMPGDRVAGFHRRCAGELAEKAGPWLGYRAFPPHRRVRQKFLDEISAAEWHLQDFKLGLPHGMIQSGRPVVRAGGESEGVPEREGVLWGPPQRVEKSSNVLDI